MTVAMAGTAEDDAGLASGLVNPTAQVGGALGLAVLATVFRQPGTSALAARRGKHRQPRSPAVTTWPSGSATRLLAIAIVVTATVVRPRRLGVEDLACALDDGRVGLQGKLIQRPVRFQT